MSRSIASKLEKRAILADDAWLPDDGSSFDHGDDSD